MVTLGSSALGDQYSGPITGRVFRLPYPQSGFGGKHEVFIDGVSQGIYDTSLTTTVDAERIKFFTIVMPQQGTYQLLVRRPDGLGPYAMFRDNILCYA